MEIREACIFASMLTVDNLTGRHMPLAEVKSLKSSNVDNITDAILPVASIFIEDEEQEQIWEDECADWYQKIVGMSLDQFAGRHQSVYAHYQAV